MYACVISLVVIMHGRASIDVTVLSVYRVTYPCYNILRLRVLYIQRVCGLLASARRPVLVV